MLPEEYHDTASLFSRCKKATRCLLTVLSVTTPFKSNWELCQVSFARTWMEERNRGSTPVEIGLPSLWFHPAFLIVLNILHPRRAHLQILLLIRKSLVAHLPSQGCDWSLWRVVLG